MNIYFACSITGGREYEAAYQAIVAALTEDGHEVPTAHLAGSEAAASEAQIGPQQVYARDTEWIRLCDLLIAEVSVPSHGVGYEIGFALALGKRVLALAQQGRKVSKMISGNPDPNLNLRIYERPEQAIDLMREYLRELEMG
jgi:nucleoside 2-deoxyribosyltransferase